jgi:hypothetical protein
LSLSKSILKSNSTFTAFILILLFVVIVIEFFLIEALQKGVAPQISETNATLMLQSLLAFNAALISFSAIVYSSFLVRDLNIRFLLNLIFWMAATVALFLVSVINTFYAFSHVTSAGLDSSFFVFPLEVTIFAITVFFFSLGSHIVRVRLKDILL